MDENESVLVVEPSDAVSLGYFEEQIFEVRLLSAEGVPMAGEPVFVSFTEPAHNAHLEPSEFYTDGYGMGSVVFTAPDQEAFFPIKFSSPTAADPFIVEVDIDPSLMKLSLQIEYSGERNFAQIEASLYEEISCKNLLEENKKDPLEVRELSSLPTGVSFSGLRSNRVYAVQVAGYNQSGELRASICQDGLLPNDTEPIVTLTDVPFEFSGKYDISTIIDSGDHLASTVDELKEACDESGFLSNPATAILDAVKVVISENEPLSEEPFDEIRDENDLDEILENHFANNSIDVAATLSPAWLGAKDYLKAIRTEGSLEFGSPDEGVFPISQQISKVSFWNEVDDPFDINVVYAEAGVGTAQRDNSDGDLVHLNKHTISLGLGTLVYQVLTNIGFEANFETTMLREVLEDTVDCDEVAEFLMQWLSEVTNKPTIASGCEAAALDAEQKLVWGVPDLDAKYSDMAFEGICRLEEPSSGNQVQFLIEGVSEITWEPVSFTGAEEFIGPMDATFEAELSNGQ